MRIKKGNEIIKVAAVSALCIGLFSTGLAGVNTLAYAQAVNKTESVQLTTSVNIPTESVPPADYQTPTLIVYESPEEYYTASTNANALTMEEAAAFGALYIWEVFGYNIDGKTVEMGYSVWPSHTRAYWHGVVLNERRPGLRDRSEKITWEEPGASFEFWEDKGPKELFSFTLDAVSSERIDITGGIAGTVGEQIEILRRNEADRRAIFALISKEPPANLDEYATAAEEFAKRHFKNSVVESVVFEESHAASFDRDRDGNLIATSRMLNFIITDETGREARISIYDQTKELSYISTQDNDIIPGFNYDAPGVG